MCPYGTHVDESLHSLGFWNECNCEHIRLFVFCPRLIEGLSVLLELCGQKCQKKEKQQLRNRVKIKDEHGGILAGSTLFVLVLPSFSSSNSLSALCNNCSYVLQLLMVIGDQIRDLGICVSTLSIWLQLIRKRKEIDRKDWHCLGCICLRVDNDSLQEMLDKLPNNKYGEDQDELEAD